MIERQDPLARMQDSSDPRVPGAERDPYPPHIPAMTGKLRAARGIALAVSASAIVWLLVYVAIER